MVVAIIKTGRSRVRVSCLFCRSRRTTYRILSCDGLYDEVSCSAHRLHLERDADKRAAGKQKLHTSSTGPLERAPNRAQAVQDFRWSEIEMAAFLAAAKAHRINDRIW